MRLHFRRYTLDALAAATVATAALVVPLVGATSWTPVRYGLAQDAATMLPATVSAAHPARVVSTALDNRGRPVVTARTATDRRSAERLVRTGQRASKAIGVELDVPVHALDAPTGTDQYRGLQWNLPTINIPVAWQKSTGAGVTVAVIDTGVDAAHPDLAGQILPGIDLITQTSGVGTDPNGHGTHVAGTIAALAGNGIGVAGLAPDAKILPIRVLDAAGSGYMSDVATGIVYAADHGAQVANLSIGSSAQLSAVTDAIAYARSKGVVVVAAAGNNRQNGSPVSYPAADDGVVAVASTDATDEYSYFSNAGGYVDIAAPGSNIASTIPVALGGYAYHSGTSMAAPHIAAVAALIKACHPALSPDQVERAIETSAVDLGAAGKDNDYGNGRVDAAAALTAALPPTTAPEPNLVPLVVTSDAATQTVDYAAMITTTFTVTAQGRPWATQPAQTCISENNGAFQCVAVTTSAEGTVTVARTATSAYRIRLAVAATPTFKAVTSRAYAYSVRAMASLAQSGAQSLTVSVSGIAGQQVEVQRYNGKYWKAVLTYSALADYVVSGMQPGSRYRVMVPKSATFEGATSNTVQL